MKMKKYYPVLKSRAKFWFSHESNRQRWEEYVTAVKKSGDYTDKEFTTLAKKVGMEVGYF